MPNLSQHLIDKPLKPKKKNILKHYLPFECLVMESAGVQVNLRNSKSINRREFSIAQTKETIETQW